MLATPERRRQRLAAIREKVDRLAPTIEVDTPTGETYVAAVRRNGSHRAPTPAERAAHENAEPRQRWAFVYETTDGLTIARPVSIARTGSREHRSPSTTRTTSRRARPSASSADPSSSRGRLSADALGALRIETTRLGLRLALLGIGGAR